MSWLMSAQYKADKGIVSQLMSVTGKKLTHGFLRMLTLWSLMKYVLHTTHGRGDSSCKLMNTQDTH